MTADTDHMARPGEPSSIEAGWLPRPHLVRWAALLLVAVVVLLSMSALFGLVTPRVATREQVDSGLLRGSDDLVYAQMVVTNSAYADAELVGAGESVPGLRLTVVSMARGEPGEDDLVPAAPSQSDDHPASVTLGHGDHATVSLLWQVTDCDEVSVRPPEIPVRLRTPLGLTRTVRATTASNLLGEIPAGTYTASNANELVGRGSGWAVWLAHPVCNPVVVPAP